MPMRPVHHASRPIVEGVLAGFLLASGCSVMLSHAPIHYEPNQGPPACMSAPVGPVLDLLAAPGVLLIGTVANALEEIGRYCDDEGYCDPPASEGNKWLLVAGGLAASSVYGFVQTGRCNAAHERHRDYRATGEVTLPTEPEPVSSICRVWQRPYRQPPPRTRDARSYARPRRSACAAEQVVPKSAAVIQRGHGIDGGGKRGLPVMIQKLAIKAFRRVEIPMHRARIYQ
jgi:hypothetical protein